MRRDRESISWTNRACRGWIDLRRLPLECSSLFMVLIVSTALLFLAPGSMAGQEDVAGRGTAPVSGFEIRNAYRHDPTAFTQGLVLCGGTLYESTGLYGKSTLRQVDLDSGRVLKSRALAPRYFGEGLACTDGKLYQLTWRSGVVIVYDRVTFSELGRFNYDHEGWGLTSDGRSLIASDGSAELRFLDPSTLAEIRRVTVRDGDAEVGNLNELEFVKGEIYANVWMRDRVARISPETGRVTGWVDLGALRDAVAPEKPGEVLNGIAYDPEGDRLFVTGKLWPKLFEIRIVPE